MAADDTVPLQTQSWGIFSSENRCCTCGGVLAVVGLSWFELLLEVTHLFQKPATSAEYAVAVNE